MNLSKLFLVIQNNALCDGIAGCIDGKEYNWLPSSKMFTSTFQWKDGTRLGAFIVLSNTSLIRDAVEIINQSIAFLNLNNDKNLEVIILLQSSSLEKVEIKILNQLNQESVILFADEFFNQFSVRQILDNIHENVLSIEDLKKFYFSWQKVKDKKTRDRKIIKSFKWFFKYFASVILSLLSALGFFFAFGFITKELYKVEEHNYWETKDERIQFLEGVVTTQLIEIEEIKFKLLNAQKIKCNSPYCAFTEEYTEEERLSLQTILNIVSPKKIMKIYLEVLDIEKAFSTNNEKTIEENVNKSLCRLMEIVQCDN